MKNNTSVFNPEFNQTVCRALEKDQVIRQKCPNWGRINIDRRLPFLCIYRRPKDRKDTGTEQLLQGQASYILIREEDAESSDFKELIKTIINNLSALYGSTLLFELWSTETSDTQRAIKDQQPVSLAIKTTRHNAPQSMLEILESALLEIPVDNRNAKITLDYNKQCHPPLMSPIFNNKEFNYQHSKDNYCYWVGLGIDSVYRQGNDMFPYILRDLHQWLTLVLRRSFYTFTRCYTKHKPAHYHQLGRQSLTNAIWKIDKQLSKIKEQFELLFHVTPVNSDEAWLEFQESNFNKTPVFNYRPRPIDPDLIKRKLYSIPIERIEDPTLSFLFYSQRNEIDRQLTMINDRNNQNFLYGSLQVYGAVELWLLKLAKYILSKLKPEVITSPATSLSATEFARQAKQLLAHYRLQVPDLQSRIIIRDDIPGIMVSKGHLMIGRHSRFLENRVAGTLAHEIGTHIVTYINGKEQPFYQFCSGLANYEPLQEGLAILAEYLVGELDSNRMRRLAARVVAVHGLIEGAEFIDVFRVLHLEHHFTTYQAYYITMRVFRGGGFTKDLVYLKGFSHLLDYLGKGGEIDILYLGKIAQDDIAFVDELRWRKVLKDGPLKPHFLHTKQSKQLLQTIRDGLSVTDLVNNLEKENKI